MSNLDRLQIAHNSETHQANLDRLRSLNSVAQMLQIAPSTLRRWAHKGQIHGHTLNAEAWSSVLDFDAFLDIPACPPPTYFRVSEILAQVSR